MNYTGGHPDASQQNGGRKALHTENRQVGAPKVPVRRPFGDPLALSLMFRVALIGARGLSDNRRQSVVSFLDLDEKRIIDSGVEWCWPGHSTHAASLMQDIRMHLRLVEELQCDGFRGPPPRLPADTDEGPFGHAQQTTSWRCRSLPLV